MSRFFYTDPLAAAWMAKHFGMRFTGSGRVREEWASTLWDVDADINFEDNSALPATNGDQWLFFIHPDSLHLLEPQLGDKILSDIGAVATVIADGTLAGSVNSICISDAPMFGRNKAPLVIFRNGMFFMWPESEAV